jgi:hypothetical protein
MITLIENILMTLGWSFFWISLAVYGSSIASKGLREGRVIIILSITGLILMSIFPLYGQYEVAALIHTIVFCGTLAGIATTLLSLRKKSKAQQGKTPPIQS